MWISRSNAQAGGILESVAWRPVPSVSCGQDEVFMPKLHIFKYVSNKHVQIGWRASCSKAFQQEKSHGTICILIQVPCLSINHEKPRHWLPTICSHTLSSVGASIWVKICIGDRYMSTGNAAMWMAKAIVGADAAQDET